MKRISLVALATLSCAGISLAQPADAPSAASGSTSSSRPVLSRASGMTTQVMERMWSIQSKRYEEIGVSQDRIEKLKDLELNAYRAAQAGEKVDYTALREERNKILTAEEQKKLEDMRRQRANAFRSRMSGAGTSETASAVPSADTKTSGGSENK